MMPQGQTRENPQTEQGCRWTLSDTVATWSRCACTRSSGPSEQPKAMQLSCCQPDHLDPPGSRMLGTEGSPGELACHQPGPASLPQPRSICALRPHRAGGSAATVCLRAELPLGLPGQHSRVTSLPTRKLRSRPRRIGDASLTSSKSCGTEGSLATGPAGSHGREVAQHKHGHAHRPRRACAASFRKSKFQGSPFSPGVAQKL